MLKYLPLKGGRKESGTDRKRRQVVYVIVIAKQNYAEKKKRTRKCQKSKQEEQSIYLFRERSREELFQITFKISILTRCYCRIIQGLNKQKKNCEKKTKLYPVLLLLLFWWACYSNVMWDIFEFKISVWAQDVFYL